MNATFLRGLAAVLLVWAQAAWAGGVIDPRVEGNTLQADVEVAGVSAELTIRFESVVGLSAANLGLSVAAINPLDPALLARLGPDATVPAAFPLMVRIEPPASGGLSFSGTVAIEIYTHDLHYAPGTPLRMFSAPLGGAFVDVTTSVGSGSYRSGGTKGDFSEFLIAADLRGSSDAIGAKFDRLSGLLAGYQPEIGGALSSQLAGLLDASRAAWQQGSLVTAIEYIEAFAEAVNENSGVGIPDVWRSTGDLDNVAGQLRAAAATLRFSLTLASNAL